MDLFNREGKTKRAAMEFNYWYWNFCDAYIEGDRHASGRYPQSDWVTHWNALDHAIRLTKDLHKIEFGKEQMYELYAPEFNRRYQSDIPERFTP